MVVKKEEVVEDGVVKRAQVGEEKGGEKESERWLVVCGGREFM